MTAVSRQTSLLAAEDWKKVYQTFREADFQSYDFETLRKTMIDYLRLYYPEDFNDFIESSEYIALVDLIAFLGQSLAFRTDLNARENFLDTAERRDSILKLARFISYTPKRSIPASGLLKITSISTTETLNDSNGVDLTNIPISWNDVTNSNWQEQFNLVLNAAMLDSQVVGKSGNSQTINGIRNDEYTINITTGTVPVFAFSATVNGTAMAFEAVSVSSLNQSYLYEVEPKPVSKFNVLYRTDNQGNSSNNTGFFLYFKQGSLQTVDFSLADAIPNRILNVGYSNVNNTDLWLYELNSSKVATTKWTQVPTVTGVNVVYNKSTNRNLFQVNTNMNDQVDLVFGDGSFANVPQGSYRLYFRTGNSQTYKITPDEMQNVSINIPYVSREGNVETLSISASLNYTVTNATASESINDIRQKAPQQYYTQGRMITGEDYNIVPYTSFSTVVKAKSINRTSSGVSRYLDINDSSGKYSSTNIFAQDGILYKKEDIQSTNFTFLSTASVQRIVQDDLQSILSAKALEHFYYANVTRTGFGDVIWNLSSLNTNGCTGYFYKVVNDLDGGGNAIGTTHNQIIQLGNSTSTSAKFLRAGAVVRFAAPTGKYFNSQNQLVSGTPKFDGDRTFMYVSISQVIGDGTNGGAGNFSNGQGPTTLAVKVPSGAIVDKVIPVFKTTLTQSFISSIAAKILAHQDFGLRYDIPTETWKLVEDVNLPTLTVSTSKITTDPFSWQFAGNTSGSNLDSSWFIRFKKTTNVGYGIYWRSLEYFFESELETKFYFDEKVKVYDSKTGSTVQDTIKVLKVNTVAGSTTERLGVDYTWNVYGNLVEVDGYVDQNRVLVTFTDNNADGIPDNPDLFDAINDPLQNLKVFVKRVSGYGGFIDYEHVTVYEYNLVDEVPVSTSNEGDVFYTTVDQKYYVLTNGVLEESLVYEYYIGREGLYFQYRHNSPSYRRIDPSSSNLMDVYLLTTTYSTDYQNWIKDSTGTVIEPNPPTSDELQIAYGSLEKVKATSDTLIFNSAKFKPLFGAKAPLSLQATFKIVKNTAVNVSDNDVKSSVINAINAFFAVDNWDFGETFYFSEMSSYLHTVLSPNVSSIIIVPKNPSYLFGSLYQINAEANEILISCATVDNVEIISAITAAQINANAAGVNIV